MNDNSISRIVERAAAKFPANSGSSFASDVREIRRKLNLTQEEFSDRYGIPLANLRNWEQPSRNIQPDTAGRLLIEMIKVAPDKVAELVKLTREPAKTTEDA